MGTKSKTEKLADKILRDMFVVIFFFWPLLWGCICGIETFSDLIYYGLKNLLWGIGLVICMFIYGYYSDYYKKMGD